jgi:hypothetical protein
MLTDGGAGGTARLGERRDIGFSPGQGVQEGEAGPVAQEGEEFGGERELSLARGTRMRIMRR